MISKKLKRKYKEAFLKFCQDMEEKKRHKVTFLNMEIKFSRLFVYTTLKIARNAICQKERNFKIIDFLLKFFENPFRFWKKNLSLKSREPKEKKTFPPTPSPREKTGRRGSLKQNEEKKDYKTKNGKINGNLTLSVNFYGFRKI